MGDPVVNLNVLVVFDDWHSMNTFLSKMQLVKTHNSSFHKEVTLKVQLLPFQTH